MRDNRTAPILVVDDDEIDRKALRRSFSKQSISNPIVEAIDGVRALEILRDTDADGAQRVSPCLVLLDLNMPRMNGIEFLSEIRNDSRLRSSVVFVLTTSHAEQDRIDAYDRNVAGYIVKAETGGGFNHLIDLLDQYLNVVELPPGNRPPPTAS